MSYEISVEQNGRGVLVTWSGPVTGPEAIAANGAIYDRDPGGNYAYQIWDYTNADSFDVAAEELRVIVMQDYTASAGNPDQVVAVVGHKHILQGMDDLYRSFAGAWTRFESRTFDTLEDARAWVDGRNADT